MATTTEASPTEPGIGRALVSEALGTALLLWTIVASGIVVERHITEVGVQLIVHGLAVGVGLAVLIAVLGPVSGAHFNPAVTLGFLRTRTLGPGRAASYIAVQVGAAVVGVVAANLMFGEPAIAVSLTERSGLAQASSEFVGTFVLVLAILVLVRAGRTSLVPSVVGGWITVIIVASPSTGFANPAVTIGRMFTDTFSGIRPVDTFAFIAVQLVAAVAAAALAMWLEQEAE